MRFKRAQYRLIITYFLIVLHCFYTLKKRPKLNSRRTRYKMEHKQLSWIPFNKLYQYNLSLNPAAIHLLEANQDKIYWNWLLGNPAAIYLLKANQDKIYWNYLSLNPAIFELDYQAMSIKRSALINDELIAVALRPERVARWHDSRHDIQFC